MARGVFVALVVCWTLIQLPGPAGVEAHAGDGRLEAVLRARAHAPAGWSHVLLRTEDGKPATARIRALGGLPGRAFASVGVQAARVPDTALHALARLPEVSTISLDRPVRGAVQDLAPAGRIIGARWVQERLGYEGAGVGIALIDSGVTAWHDDLDAARIVHFADFVNARAGLYDDYGHGTHVAGIIAGNGHHSNGARRGIAPAADLVILKALDGAGGGYISTVIAAIDYAIANRDAYNIRVINLSVSAGVYESYTKDPLTLAAKRAVDAGIVVVAAAGNLGEGVSGGAQYGGIAAPGNAPWVLTVGASSHNGTLDRADDEVAAFSSRGPAAIDRIAKPDLVAPGVGVESVAEPSSVLFAAHPEGRIPGELDSISEPYLRLSGTSMAAPAVAATAALMLEANPSLTPNGVKAILQFTAETHRDYDHYTQGAGFLNARGAVELARRFREGAGLDLAAPASGDPVRWSRQLIWGKTRQTGGMIAPDANAWMPGVVWGASRTPSGDPIVWGALCEPGEARCSGPAWTGASRPRGTGDAPEARFGEAACDDPACFPELWQWASTPTGEHGLVSGSVAREPEPR